MKEVNVNIGRDRLIIGFDHNNKRVAMKFYTVPRKGWSPVQKLSGYISYDNFKTLIAESKEIRWNRVFDLDLGDNTGIRAVWVDNYNVMYSYVKDGSILTTRFLSNRLDMAIKMIELAGGELLYAK